ncbi:hypothetical protein BB560_007216, partial [Smittium megazygosporum]
MSRIACVKDIEEIAIRKLDKNALDFYYTGAQDQLTLANNRTCYDRYKLLPRVLRDVSKVDLSITLFGHKFASPILVAPTGLQKLAHSDGELATVRAAVRKGAGYTLSTMSTTSIEDVASAALKAEKALSSKGQTIDGDKGGRWYQLYVFKDRSVSLDLIRRAEAAGFEALVITVDAPILGNRLANKRNSFTLPSHMEFGNFKSYAKLVASSNLAGVEKGSIAQGTAEADPGYWLARFSKDQLDPSLTWKDIEWLKENTKLPILLKGILTHEDARLAVYYGVDGIIVSNHGGRQLDGVPATIDVLSEISVA